MPKFIVVCWMIEGRAIFVIDENIDEEKSLFILPSMTFSVFRRMMNESTAESACEMRVAHAAPAIPMPRAVTAAMSRTMFSRDENMRRESGILDFPSELKTEERMLYMKRNGRPRKYIFR